MTINNFKTKKQLNEFANELKLILSSKPQATSSKLARESRYGLRIKSVHDKWCIDNGYPVTGHKPQAGRPKASSAKLQKF